MHLVLSINLLTYLSLSLSFKIHIFAFKFPISCVIEAECKRQVLQVPFSRNAHQWIQVVLPKSITKTTMPAYQDVCIIMRRLRGVRNAKRCILLTSKFILDRNPVGPRTSDIDLSRILARMVSWKTNKKTIEELCFRRDILKGCHITFKRKKGKIQKTY